MNNTLSTVPRTFSHGENTIIKSCETANFFNPIQDGLFWGC